MRWLSSVIPIWFRRKAMIGAKSFSDQDSKSGGGGSVPVVATSESLTVHRGQGREDTIHVHYEQEAILVTDQAPYERARLAQPKLWRRLDFLGSEFQHVGNPIHQQSRDLGIRSNRR